MLNMERLISEWFARLNGTYESIYQKLKRPLVANQQYKFSISLCVHLLFITIGMNIGPIWKKVFWILKDPYNLQFYNTSLLRIIGGRKDCKMLQLLAESPLIDNYDWKKFVLHLPYWKLRSHFYLQAFYKDDKTPCNGNILLDNASTIRQLFPNSLQPLAND